MEPWVIQQKKKDVQDMLDVAEVCLKVLRTRKVPTSVELLLSNIKTLKGELKDLNKKYDEALNKDLRGW